MWCYTTSMNAMVPYGVMAPHGDIVPCGFMVVCGKELVELYYPIESYNII